MYPSALRLGGPSHLRRLPSSSATSASSSQTIYAPRPCAPSADMRWRNGRQPPHLLNLSISCTVGMPTQLEVHTDAHYTHVAPRCDEASRATRERLRVAATLLSARRARRRTQCVCRLLNSTTVPLNYFSAVSDSRIGVLHWGGSCPMRSSRDI